MSTVGAFVVAHCPYCAHPAEWRIGDDSAWCACLATRIARDGVTGTVHVTIVPAGDQAGESIDPPRERLTIGAQTYRPAQPGETPDIWWSDASEGIAHRGYVKVR